MYVWWVMMFRVFILSAKPPSRISYNSAKIMMM